MGGPGASWKISDISLSPLKELIPWICESPWMTERYCRQTTDAVSLLLLSFLSLLCLFFFSPIPQVQHVFDESPFSVPDNSVSIMDGTEEGSVCLPLSHPKATKLQISWQNFTSPDSLVLLSLSVCLLGHSWPLRWRL